MSGDDAAAKRASSRDHFDRWAHQYERDHVSRWLATLQRHSLDALELGPSDQLIDVGCGTGAAVRAAAPTVRHSVGVDLSPGMLDRARELASGAASVEFRVADAEVLPFRDSTFSALLCTTSFHHYPAPEGAVSEMARVLAPGGRIVIADMITDRHVMRIVDHLLRRAQPSHARCYRTHDLEQLLIGAGLTEPSTRCLMHGFYAILAAHRPK